MWEADNSEFVYEFKNSKTQNSGKGYVTRFYSDKYSSLTKDDEKTPVKEYWICRAEIVSKSGQKFAKILKGEDNQLLKFSKKENAENEVISVIRELLDN